LIKDDNLGFRTVNGEGYGEENVLKEVFRDGKVLISYSLDEVRKNATL
jgi:hypothetical protein